MKLDHSIRTLPQTGPCKDATGLPFSCVVQPFARLSAAQSSMPAQMPAFLDVLRCSKCYGYINCHCAFQPPSWQCSLCQHMNDIKHMWALRYSKGLEALPELRSEVYEMLMDQAGPAGVNELGDPQGPAPVVLALVDLTGGEEWLELVRSSLMAALEGLPAYTLFGLLSFSHKLGLHDVRASVPSVRYVSFKESATHPLTIPCSQVVPLRALLAPVGLYKEKIMEAIEALAPEAPSQPPSGHNTAQPQGAAMTPPGAPGDAAAHAHAANSNGAVAAATQGLQHMSMSRTAGQQAGRGLGPALLGILEYLQAVNRPPFRPTAADLHGSAGTGAQQGLDALPPVQSPVRLMTFLAGPPDWGAGRLLNPKRHARNVARVVMQSGQEVVLPPDDTWTQDVSPEAAQFYQQASVAAAAIGCCCDLFTVCEGAVGLQYLEPLCSATGGVMHMYPSVEDSALPQDVYRRLSYAHASAGVLRMRCSPAFKPVRFYGRLFAGEQVENLHHIISCCDADTFAVDFELASPAGFTAPGQSAATLQVAFQYTTVVPAEADTSSKQPNGQAAAPTKCLLQRRLRVATFKLPTSNSPLAIMRSCSPEALLVVLLHKIQKVAQLQGASRARVVLRDWLANLATNYHHLVHEQAARSGAAALAQIPVDVSFAQVEALQPIPRLVYALLRSPLLAPAIETQHPDLVSFMTHLWCSLPPAELQRAVYPALSSYADPDRLVLSRHSLSRGALLAEGAPPIFLLDAYVLLVVLYTQRAPPGIPFPPPQTSALRKALAAIRQERRITPQVRFVREGSDEAALFFHLLLDEPDNGRPTTTAQGAPLSGETAGSTPAAQYGLVQFMEHIRLEVVSALRSEVQTAAGGQ